jgi:outer membrane protein assembly factor BamA
LAQVAGPGAPAQTTPKTGDSSLLSSYEGQNVSSIEIAGRPGYDASNCPQFLVQKAGQPFSLEKVQQTVSALKAAGKFDDVQI